MTYSTEIVIGNEEVPYQVTLGWSSDHELIWLEEIDHPIAEDFDLSLLVYKSRDGDVALDDYLKDRAIEKLVDDGGIAGVEAANKADQDYEDMRHDY